MKSLSAARGRDHSGLRCDVGIGCLLGVIITLKWHRCEGSGQQHSLQVIKELRYKIITAITQSFSLLLEVQGNAPRPRVSLLRSCYLVLILEDKKFMNLGLL